MGSLRPLSAWTRRYPLRWRTRSPMLWVFAFSPADHVRVAVTARTVTGGDWAYHQAGRGRHGYLAPCGDTKYAADQVDGLLKHRMYPATW